MTDMARRTTAPAGWRFHRGLWTRFPVAKHWRSQTHIAGDNAIITHERIPGIRTETTWQQFRNTPQEMVNWAQWRGNDKTFTFDFATVLETRHITLAGQPGFLLDLITCKDDIYLWHRELGYFQDQTDLCLVGMTGNPNEIEARRADFDAMLERSSLNGVKGLIWRERFQVTLNKEEALSWQR
ncbi:MAG: hypothetical protein KDC35_14935 [Acidobacteria bacterium]|nr:hypothetical protein [Acidobacteriota bacterium]